MLILCASLCLCDEQELKHTVSPQPRSCPAFHVFGVRKSAKSRHINAPARGPCPALLHSAVTRQEATTMTRINAIRNTATSVTWGKSLAGDLHVYAFAA